ncbi:hypothetical protein [Streptomyces sp. NBC_00091]|uniref:hypothetical protein n=1 Tax=Streptomyces sp. NBC_00091 TaxID=2975648 RepID=UPI00224FCF35|nr:hypothetical protein [Streptomyces sp. NBC_00091]MCX5380571.1 hypothetical protein [Streptomyces sp. NBC_00091]
MKRLRALVAVGVLALGSAGAGTAQASPPSPASESSGCPAAEIFATDNTAVITDPADPRLQTRLKRFDREVREIIRANGARAGSSTLLDGVFWSQEEQQATYERSREFDVAQVSADGLHHIADVIRKRYEQESVLTFRCLPRSSPETDAVEIQAPGVSATRLRDALLADPEARDRLGGGSVALDGRLILVAPLADLPLARKFTAALGVDWNKAEVRYGDEEFVA